MTFSVQWDQVYTEGRQLSQWPWPSLISRVLRFADWRKTDFRVLELGCGVGANIPFFQQIEANYHAIEGSSVALEFIKRKFPHLTDKLVLGDFTERLVEGATFDLIFDRASLTHNDTVSISRSLKLVENSLEPDGIFIGIDWFSSRNSLARLGSPLAGDSGTRVLIASQPYAGIGPVRFSSKEEMHAFFSRFEVLQLDEELLRTTQPESEIVLASWHIVARKPKAYHPGKMR